MNLANVQNINGYLEKLQALGLSGEQSLEQFVNMAQVAGPELADYLGVPVSDLVQTVNESTNAAAQIPMQSLDQIRDGIFTLGAAIENIPPLIAAPVFSLPPAAPPPSVNMINDMPPIRNQAHRGTCVAHAALSAYEHFLNVNGALQDMSEQFLYWNCKRNDGIPNSPGTWLGVAVPLLQRDGCCLENTWAYNPDPIPNNEGQAPPPNNAQIQALSFRAQNYRQLSPTSVTDIKNELINGRCVAFSIPVFNSWYGSQWVAYSGDITMPIPNEIAVGGHAMCFVGYIDTGNVGLGGGRFIIRNSWGGNWGINNQFGVAGYGTIPYAYIARMGSEAYSVS
jgi:hypothetical protein